MREVGLAVGRPLSAQLILLGDAPVAYSRFVIPTSLDVGDPKPATRWWPKAAYWR